MYLCNSYYSMVNTAIQSYSARVQGQNPDGRLRGGGAELIYKSIGSDPSMVNRAVLWIQVLLSGSGSDSFVQIRTRTKSGSEKSWSDPQTTPSNCVHVKHIFKIKLNLVITFNCYVVHCPVLVRLLQNLIKKHHLGLT